MTRAEDRHVELIAHRGYAARYPENTLESISAAAESGARWIEFDIQLTADGVPVLMHDATLDRTTGEAGNVMDLEFAELAAFRPSEPQRFGSKFRDVRIPTLKEVVNALREWPGVSVFVEIKGESIERFGSRFTVARVIEALQPAMQQCVVISFVAEAVAQARELGAPRVGWAIREFNGVTRKEAELLSPQFIFCDYRAIPPAGSKNPKPLWPGPWRWAVWEVGNAGLAIHIASLGADLIETFEIGTLIRHPRLAPGA